MSKDPTWQLCLATLVLTGILTEEQLQKLVDSDSTPAENWRDIIKQIRAAGIDKETEQ